MAGRSIEREIGIDAPPEVVYRVISYAEHLRNWWPDHAELGAVPGGTGSSRTARTGRNGRSWR